MDLKKLFLNLATGFLLMIISGLSTSAQVVPIVPPDKELNRSFGEYDKVSFMAPPKVYYPETWFHFIGGNVSKKGITADLEAIAHSGISGIQLFHGQFGGPWPGVNPQITCLSPLWEDALLHTAQECRRLGLRFTMQNCPGWAMAGGPWITPANAMRHLAYSRTEIKGGKGVINIPLNQPQSGGESWRDYKDIAVLAFPTPSGDMEKPLAPQSVKGSSNISWSDFILKQAQQPLRLPPATSENPYWVEVTFPDTVTVRTIEFPGVNSFSHAWNYEPGVKIKVLAIMANGETKEILNTNIPAANFQDNQPVSFACQEIKGAKKFKVSIENKHHLAMSYIHFFSAARKNNWESEAG